MPMARLAAGATVVNTGELVLFVGFGSFVGLPPPARLVRLLPSTGAVTTRLRPGKVVWYRMPHETAAT